MEYTCVLLENGKKIKRSLTSDNEIELKKDLKAQGLTIIRIKKKSTLNIEIIPSKVSKKDLIDLCDEIVECNSSVTLIDIIAVLVKSNIKHKEVYECILQDLCRGVSFSDSLRTTKKFPSEFIQIVELGEQSGKLIEALNSVKEYYASSMQVEGKLKMQSIYPSMLLGVGLLTMTIFVKFIVPNLKDLFGSQKLPALTQFYLDALRVFNNNLTLILGVILAIISLYMYALKVPKSRFYIDMLKVRISPFKNITKLGMLSRFIRFMHLMYSSNVQLSTSITELKDIINNSYISKQLDIASKELNSGKPLYESIKGVEIIDAMTLMRIEQAEKAGKLDTVLLSISKNLDSKILKALAKFNALIEPVIIIVLAIIAGSFVMAMMLPIMDMSTAIQSSFGR